MEQKNLEMSKEKQIEEMAKDVWKASCAGHSIECTKCEYANNSTDEYSCVDFVISQNLYNAGYRKQSEGEWLYSEIYCTYICSECEECAPVDDYREPRLTDFCPNCGAKMKGGAE